MVSKSASKLNSEEKHWIAVAEPDAQRLEFRPEEQQETRKTSVLKEGWIH